MILLGLGAERLLAGLGLAARGEIDDPGQVALAVDLLLHRSSPTEACSSPTEAGLLVAEGARRWRAARPVLAATVPVGPTTADIRGGFARVHRAVGRTELRNQGIAGLAYLTACWIRRFDVDPPAGIES